MKYHLITTMLLLISLAGLHTALAQERDTTAFAHKKPLFDFEYEKPLFKLKNEQLNNKHKSLRFSAVTGYREGVKPIEGAYGVNFGRFNDPKTGTARIAMYNLSIVEMLNHFPVNPAEVVLEVKDPSRYLHDPKYGSKEEWMRKHTYCYEYLMPDGKISGTKQFEDDIAACFGIQVHREKRMSGNKEITVLVIQEIN